MLHKTVFPTNMCSQCH